jgi:hypothetical protein
MHKIKRKKITSVGFRLLSVQSTVLYVVGGLGASYFGIAEEFLTRY